MNPKPKPSSLIPIYLLFLVTVAIYSWYTPPFEAPDEFRHFRFVTWLVNKQSLPPMGEAAWQTQVAQEAGQPPFYYALAAIPVAIYQQIAPDEVAENRLVFRPNLTYFGPPPRDYHDNDNIAIHYPSDIRPLRGEWLALFLARGVTMGFGLLLIYATYQLGFAFFAGNQQMAWGTALLVALLPQVIFLSGGVSNDIPMAALATLSLWRLLLLIQAGVGSNMRGNAGILGIFLGLAIMSKISALILGPAVALAYGWLFLRASRSEKRQVVGAVFITSGVVLLVSGWWFARSWWLYGSPFGLSSHDYAPWAHTAANEVERSPILEEWNRVFESFWVAIGWGSIRFDRWVYGILYGIVGLALVGLGKKMRGSSMLARIGYDPRAVFVLLLAVTFMMAMVMLELWMRRVTADYGRLLYPALGVILLFLVMGWRELWRGLVWVNAGILLILTIATPIYLIIPAFHPSPLTAAEIAQLPDSIGWRYGDMVELISVTPLASSVQASKISLFPIEICYRTLQPSGAQPYHLFVHIIGQENALIANRYTIPGLGSLPTETWPPNTYMCDTVAVRIWENLAETLVYKIEVGFITPDLETRLPAFDRQNNLLETTFVGEVKLIANEPIQPFTPTSDEPVVLIKADVGSVWQAGTMAEYTLHWGVGAEMPANYQLFVHLRDLATGQPIAQGDGAPFGGWYGTAWWDVGEVVVEPRQFWLPLDTPAGTYNLVVGFYDLETGARFGTEWEVEMVNVTN